MTAIRYIVGDATLPEGPGPKVIVHVCNDIGAWGRGFVVSLSKRHPQPEAAYRQWHAAPPKELPFELGQVQFVSIRDDLWVANLIGQHDIARKHMPTEVPPVRYEAIEKGLLSLSTFARAHGASVHMPRMGAGLAGGEWSRIEEIVKRTLESQSISVTVYDLP